MNNRCCNSDRFNILHAVILIAGIFVSGAFCGDNKEFAQTKIDYNPENYVCYRSGSTILIDGDLQESGWQTAQWTDAFVDIEGHLKPPPAYKTRAKMLWDDDYFYMAAELDEPHIWAKLKQRDTVIYYDNDFEVFIDPDGDTHEYFELEINAFGTEWDLLLTKPYRDGASAIDGYDMAGLKSAVKVNGTLNNPSDIDESWTIEIAIPWKAFKDCAHMSLPPVSGDQWRVNFSRVQWQVDIKNGGYFKKTDPKTGKHFPENNWVWSPQGLIAMHAPETWGFVQFSNSTGNVKTDFVPDKADEVRWALRRLYYNLRTYQLNHGKFTTKLGELDLDNVELQGFDWPPSVHVTPSGFEAILSSKNGKERWHIAHDGRIWQSTLNNK